MALMQNKSTQNKMLLILTPKGDIDLDVDAKVKASFKKSKVMLMLIPK